VEIVMTRGDGAYEATITWIEQATIKKLTVMAKHVLFVLGSGEGAHEADEKLAASLRGAFGTAYDVRCPKMLNEARPEYEAWEKQIARELATLFSACR
jgi:hypothetical protein